MQKEVMVEINKLIRRSKLAKRFFFLVTALVLVASFSTLFWQKTNGVMTESISKHSLNRYSSVRDKQVKLYGVKGSFRWPNTTYEFKHGDNFYKSTLICICLPVGLITPQAGQPVTVSYLPFLPEISVIETGPHFLISFILGFCALAAHLLEVFVSKYAKQYA